MTPDNETQPVPLGQQVPHGALIGHPDCRLCGTLDDQCGFPSCVLPEQHIAAELRLDRLHREHRGGVLYPESVTSTREGRIAAGVEQPEPDQVQCSTCGQLGRLGEIHDDTHPHHVVLFTPNVINNPVVQGHLVHDGKLYPMTMTPPDETGEGVIKSDNTRPVINTEDLIPAGPRKRELPPLDHVPGCEGRPHPPTQVCNSCPNQHHLLDPEQYDALKAMHMIEDHFPGSLLNPKPVDCQCIDHSDCTDMCDCTRHDDDHDDPPRFHSGGYTGPHIELEALDRQHAVHVARAVLADPECRRLIKGLIDEIDGKTSVRVEGSFKLTNTDDEGRPWVWRCTTCDLLYDRPDPHGAPGFEDRPFCPAVSWRQETRS